MNTSNPDILFTISQSIHSSAFDQLVYVFMRNGKLWNSAVSPARAKRHSVRVTCGCALPSNRSCHTYTQLQLARFNILQQIYMNITYIYL